MGTRVSNRLGHMEHTNMHMNIIYLGIHNLRDVHQTLPQRANIIFLTSRLLGSFGAGLITFYYGH